jgi:low affinity Fe/Cu permease
LSQIAPQRDAGHGASATHGVSALFTRFAARVAHWAGRPSAFVLCCVLLLIWAATGPIFRFSDTWQLIINTGTTIVTFLMVFLIQNTQNRDGAALQAKLDELIRVTESARDTLIGIERLPEEVVEEVREQGAISVTPEKIDPHPNG